MPHDPELVAEARARLAKARMDLAAATFGLTAEPPFAADSDPQRRSGEKMRTIETTATVGPDGTLTGQVPPEVPPGQHRVVLVIDEEPAGEEKTALFDFPVDDWGPWPESLTLRREDMYDDWGR
jgi:hypothetical protein